MCGESNLKQPKRRKTADVPTEQICNQNYRHSRLVVIKEWSHSIKFSSINSYSSQPQTIKENDTFLHQSYLLYTTLKLGIFKFKSSTLIEENILQLKFLKKVLKVQKFKSNFFEELISAKPPSSFACSKQRLKIRIAMLALYQ